MAAFTAEERRVLEFLKSRETSSNTGIAKELAIEEKKVNEILHALRQGYFVLFKQDFHLTRGELMVVKITKARHNRITRTARRYCFCSCNGL